MSEKSEERRRELRHPVKIEVDYEADGTFLFAYITDISSMGIFVRTPEPLAVGTITQLRFRPPHRVASSDPRESHGESSAPPRSDAPIELQGEVKWNTLSGGDQGHSGMGIQFKSIELGQRSRLIDLIHAVAYLDGSAD